MPSTLVYCDNPCEPRSIRTQLPSIRWRNIKHTTQLSQRRATVVHCQMMQVTNIAHRYFFDMPQWTSRELKTLYLSDHNNQKIQNNGCQYEINEKCKHFWHSFDTDRRLPSWISRFALRCNRRSSQPWEDINFTWKPLYWYPRNPGWRSLSSERLDLLERAKGEESMRPGNDTITAGHVHTYHT